MRRARRLANRSLLQENSSEGAREETLRKSFIVVLTAAAGGAGYAGAVTGVGSEPSVSDPSTWRWFVSSVMDHQQRPPPGSAAGVGATGGGGFDQPYQRYTPSGVPEPPSARTP